MEIGETAGIRYAYKELNTGTPSTPMPPLGGLHPPCRFHSSYHAVVRAGRSFRRKHALITLVEE